eukprot:TRINITY_DN28688_c0_g3_i1.p1 TRINITY_DN28688_c0_g3~~TRINITY_DN28688_c0_g3_i1.p1  ORF type:complete len:524 (+),score=184.82 TRINITY_DN28688_c0_g3_i1:90-1574(+)
MQGLSARGAVLAATALAVFCLLTMLQGSGDAPHARIVTADASIGAIVVHNTSKGGGGHSAAAASRTAAESSPAPAAVTPQPQSREAAAAQTQPPHGSAAAAAVAGRQEASAAGAEPAGGGSGGGSAGGAIPFNESAHDAGDDGPPLAYLRAKVVGDDCMAHQLRWSYTEVEVKGHMRSVLPPTMHGDHAVDDFVRQLRSELDGRLCRPGEFEAPVVVDVGANIGQGLGTWLALARCPRSCVVAFEGQYATWKVLRSTARDLAKRFRFNISGHGARLLAINKAVGERNARVTFWDNYGEGRVGNRAEIFSQKGGGRVKWTPYNSQHSSLTPLTKYAKAMKVKMVRLDSTLPLMLGHRKLVLLKTDAEGHDLPALRGAKRLFDKGLADIVMFEYNRRLWLKSGNYTLRQARDYLHANGFAVYLLAAKVLGIDPPQDPGHWDSDGREKMIMTGLGLRKGSTVACLLAKSGWLASQSAHDKCTKYLTDPVSEGCGDAK